MNNSDRDPDAIDRIREDALTEPQPVASNLHNRIMNIPVVLRDMLDITTDPNLDSVQVYKRGHRDARHAAAEIANEAAARIRELEAQLATVRSELAMVEAGAGVIEAQRDELQRALKAKTDWVEKVGERAAKLASRIASNDYEVQAMESLANELAAATERERAATEMLKRITRRENWSFSVGAVVAAEITLAAAQPASESENNNG